jgi:hypothetical protein
VPGPIYERLPNESEQAYRAFLTYRDLGPDRTTTEAYRLSGGQDGSKRGARQTCGRWNKWARDYRWDERAKAWDDHLQAQRDEVAAAEAREWEERRRRAFREAYDDAQLLKAKARDILKMPLVRKETEEQDEERDAKGNVRKVVKRVVLKPVNFRHRDAAAMIGMAGQMEQFAIKGALPVITGAEDEDGDEEPLTAEEATLLRKTLREHRARKRAADAADDAGRQAGDA